MELNVPVNDEHLEELRLSNTQSPAPDYTAMVVGHFLRKLYTDMLEEEFPERLQQACCTDERIGNRSRVA